MALLTRPAETKVFGSTALAAELTVFGTATVSTDIDLILNSTEAQRGWGTVGANDFPPLEWFNAVGYGLSYQTAYLFQQGIPQWTALQEFYINSYCIGSNGKQYRSKTGVSGTPNSGNDPTTDIINWTESIKEDLPEVINAAPSKATPIGADKLGIYDSISGLLRSVSFTDFWASLSGRFAPINSPALTGTPKAPTAADGTDTTQIATTAFVLANSGSMIAEHTVGATPETSINFPALDIASHKSYRIEIDWVNNTVNAPDLYLFMNGDTTLTNYYTQVDQGFASTANASNSNSAKIGACALSDSAIVDARVSLVLGSYARVRSECSYGSGTGTIVQKWGMRKVSAVANITSLTLISSIAGCFTQGTMIRIYAGSKQ